MKKRWKQILILAVVFALLLPCFGVPVYASNDILSESERLLLVEALQEIESQKSVWGLDEIDFCDLHVGAPVQTYNYVRNRLEPSRQLYPIIKKGQLVLWAAKYSGQYQFSNGLVSEVNNHITANTPFALLYDDSAAYIYTQGKVIQLKEFTHKLDTRSSINSKFSVSEHEIAVASLTESIPIKYVQHNQRAASDYKSCNVGFVPQHPYNNLCWAATVACIYNYLHNLTGSAAYSVETVARAYFSGQISDQAMLWDHMPHVRNKFNLPYVPMGYNATQSLHYGKIHSSIANGYPVLGWFNVSGGGAHAVTIYGSNLISGNMVIMDPEGGSQWLSLQSGGGYYYVSIYTNETLTLGGAYYHETS